MNYRNVVSITWVSSHTQLETGSVLIISVKDTHGYPYIFILSNLLEGSAQESATEGGAPTARK